MPSSLDEILSKYKPGRRQSLLAVLQDIQDEFGFLNEEFITLVSRYLNLPASKVYGIATFYNQFRFTPMGKCHIKICNGTSCHMHGAPAVKKELESITGIKTGQTGRDGFYSMEEINCVGACGQSPVISVNNEFYKSVTAGELKPILEKYRKRL